MDRGEAIKSFKAQKEADAARKATEEAAPKAEEQSQQPPTKPTPEQIQAFTQNTAAYAKSRIVPEVAKYAAGRVATALAKTLWPDEDVKMPDITQDRANDLTAALSELFYMQLEDALPAILGHSRMSMSADPVFGRVEQDTIRAQAFEQMDGMKDTAGKTLFPDLEEMVDNGTLRKVVAENPEISKMRAGNGSDPVANEKLRLQTAYRIARGERVNLSVQTVTTAVETGKKQAESRAKKIASGRVSSGAPKGGFSKGQSQGQQMISDIVSGTGSKFSAALKNSRRD
jgi:hypothetical protein